MSYRSSIYLSLVALFILLILYTLSTFGMLGDSPVGQTSVDSAPLIVPAGYAFSIWGPIYLGLIAFPIFQLVKKRDNNELWHKIRIWYALNVIGNGLWLAFASYNWQWTTVLIILFMLYSVYRIYDLLQQLKTKGAAINYWGEQLVFSIYFAWLTLATVLNVSSALHFYSWDGFGISQVVWGLIIIPIAALIAGLVSFKYRDIAYAGVVVWAFTALCVKQWEVYPLIAYMALGVVILFSILIVVFGLNRRVSV